MPVAIIGMSDALVAFRAGWKSTPGPLRVRLIHVSISNEQWEAARQLGMGNVAEGALDKIPA